MKVVVAATAPDIQAEGIARAVAGRDDMTLVAGRVLTVSDVEALLESRSLTGQCGIILVGTDADTHDPAERYLARFQDCVVMRVTAPLGDVVRVATHQLGLQELLRELRALVDQSGIGPRGRIAHLRADCLETGRADTAVRDGALLNAAIQWIHETLRNAVLGLAGGNGDLPGLTVTASTLVELLDAAPEQATANATNSLQAADSALVRAINQTEGSGEPLASMVRDLELSHFEFRLLLLALAPELDARYQRCMGVLLDDLGRRVGTLGLYVALLGEPVGVRVALASTGNLIRWRVFETQTGVLPAADEPLRLDPVLVGWILGERDAPARDARARRVTRHTAWPGAMLIDVETERVRVSGFIELLQAEHDGQLVLFAGDDASSWRSLLEVGAEVRRVSPIRIEDARIVNLDATDIEECGIRLGRAARLTGAPLVIDATSSAGTVEGDHALRSLFAGIAGTGCRAAVICIDSARIVRVAGSMPFLLMEGPPLSHAARADAFAVAAELSGATLAAEQARGLLALHPLQIDGIQQAVMLARSVQSPNTTAERRFDTFMSACKQVSAEGLSHLAERLEPMFSLDEVVLPADRKQQLREIVDNVRFADRVLHGWKFGEQLPYGRGVTALLHGPSGTGKTMSALAVAKQLGVQILRIDLSRVVSKYIGDTEKNIDRVFNDASASGAALLIDEADALFGKRSEVKDAHDRYANIEVAYLLQRMEAYEGLAILTTNLRQNLDAAFLRRLRFIIDFPRPDVEAREEIWRCCLPEKSHTLDAAAFRQLARKVELTGGHIRQITLRAAFVAAAANDSIGLPHVAYATNAELAKLGRPAVMLELAGVRKAA
ncbi:ATP-binding protein [Variovorax sp. J22R133]|uniref:ATP-binding protein n=1 Tax=Variovorax brevis TaxID=3053503 RepID=UPI0025772FF1|nr:ATP-binding protein [Variovorax sp. J22R133]MDM0116710.1 ATP-binding protein [Variovorax sp. J22R133]